MKFDKDITTEQLMAVDYRYQYSEKELLEDWERLRKTQSFKTGAQFKPGMKLCQHYFPNFWEIEDARGNSFAKAWQDPIVMDRVRLWGLSGMSNLWLSWIRRAVYMAAGLPNSSFYRPHFAKQITKMTGKMEGTLFDPCAGWAGRLLGTVANGWNYVACEPNRETFDGIHRVLDLIQTDCDVKLYNIPAEQFDFASQQKVDVVLTSPPYFNLEVYNQDSTQSYHKYNEYTVWRDQWLEPLIVNCLSILKDDGISAWNVMNIKGKDFVGDVLSIHEKHGWKLIDTVGFQSPLNNIRKLKNKDVTYLMKKI
jgi:hypothetical protein